MFKRGRHIYLSTFRISHDYYESPKRTLRANRNNYHIFKPNNLGDVQKLSQEEASRNMNLKELKYLTSTCWVKKYQTLTIDMTKDKYTGRYR